MSRSLQLTSHLPAAPVCIVCGLQCCPGCRCLDVPLSFWMKFSGVLPAPSSVCLMAYTLLQVIQAQNQILCLLSWTYSHFDLFYQCHLYTFFFHSQNWHLVETVIIFDPAWKQFQLSSILYCKGNQSINHQSINQLINQPTFVRGSHTTHLKLVIKPRMALNSWSFWLHLSSCGVIDIPQPIG